MHNFNVFRIHASKLNTNNPDVGDEGFMDFKIIGCYAMAETNFRAFLTL